MEVNKIICGNCLEVMKDWPAEFVNCCITSPPYWALRDYGVDGQLGLEKTFEEYIDKLCTIYNEVKRVLRKDGTCWINLGDTYSSKPTGSRGSKSNVWHRPSRDESMKVQIDAPFQEKSLCLIPERFAIEMVNRGWILRNVIIWHKPNPMPSSAKDRFTVDFEYVFFFVKAKKYFFEPQYEPIAESTIGRGPVDFGGEKGRKYQPDKADPNFRNGNEQWGRTFDYKKSSLLGRNKRCVWTIPTQPYPEAHFATYPEELVRPMIKAGCPRYVCNKCGQPRRKVYELGKVQSTGGGYVLHEGNPNKLTKGKVKTTMIQREHHFKGYSDCGCNAGFSPGIVLDPFVEAARLYRSLPRKRWTISGLN
jgi:site-specific DNA-methyltransferase (adenine-specific)